MDDGNGLQYMRARYYRPDVARFLSLDQLAGSAASPQSLNRYAYALGNPVMGVDPSGLCNDNTYGAGSTFEPPCFQYSAPSDTKPYNSTGNFTGVGSTQYIPDSQRLPGYFVPTDRKPYSVTKTSGSQTTTSIYTPSNNVSMPNTVAQFSVDARLLNAEFKKGFEGSEKTIYAQAGASLFVKQDVSWVEIKLPSAELRGCFSADTASTNWFDFTLEGCVGPGTPSGLSVHVKSERSAITGFGLSGDVGVVAVKARIGINLDVAAKTEVVNQYSNANNYLNSESCWSNIDRCVRGLFGK